eukprot:760045-Hanusia_phi.AAC.2
MLVSSLLAEPSANRDKLADERLVEQRLNTGSDIDDALSALAKQAGVSNEALIMLRQVVHNSNTQRPTQQDFTASPTSTDLGGSRRPFKPASSKRQQLTAEEAVEIYKMRPIAGKGGNLRRGSMLHCKAVAPRYGVTPKTIRDVWSGRSWSEATRHLWTEDEVMRRTAGGEDEIFEHPKKSLAASASVTRDTSEVVSRVRESEGLQLPARQPSLVKPTAVGGSLLSNPLLLGLALYNSNLTGQAMTPVMFNQQSRPALLPLPVSLNSFLPSSSSLSYGLGLLSPQAPFNR